MSLKKDSLNTIKRSKLRLAFGKTYYSFCRYIFWILKHKSFAKSKSLNKLSFVHFNHKTILLRKLKDVDMQYQYNKIVNLKIAVNKINGIIIKPGETFSYWRLIGKPTYKKGYLDGMVLNCGVVKTGCGGGLCQLSNLIFWITLHTPLEVIERHRHGYDVFPDSNRTQPFGSGATCFYPYNDLMIYNPTNEEYQLWVEVKEEYLEGEWRSNQTSIYKYLVVERNHKMVGEWFGGYSRHNELYKQTFDLNNNFICEKLVAENHAMMMYEPFISTDIIENSN